MAVNILFATPHNAIVEYRTMDLDILSKTHYYLKHPVLDSSAPRTLKEFMKSLPKEHSLELFGYSDWIFWRGLILNIAASNPLIPRIEFHFSYTYGEVSTVFTLAYDGGEVWFNKYLNKTVIEKFYSKNRGCFRKPINPYSDSSNVFDIQKYIKKQPTILFDEMKKLDTVIKDEEKKIIDEIVINNLIRSGI